MEVSVIIPVYNAEKYLIEAIESALLQAEVKEIILVEDGSEDNSYALCQQMSREYARIELFSHPGNINLGPSASRNLGIRKAKFPFIGFLDADDFYHRNRFKLTSELFKNNEETMMVYESAEWKKEHTSDPIKEYASKQIYFTGIGDSYKDFKDYFIGTKGWLTLNACTFKKEVFSKIGYFDEKLRLTQDTDLLLRIFLNSNTSKTENEKPVAVARDHKTRRTQNKDKVLQNKQRFYEKWMGIMVESSWDKKLNRFVFNNYLNFSSSKICNEKNAAKRKMKKISLAINEMINNPVLLKKIL